MKKYHIRYNTMCGESSLRWRVFEDGKEYLVKSFQITTPVRDEKTIENGVEKWNLSCTGIMKIVDDIAYIS